MPIQSLIFEQVLFQQASSALVAEVRRQRSPKVLQGLVYCLGHQGSDISRLLSISPQTVTNWLAGRFPIAPWHQQRLVSLLRAAVVVAEQALEDAPPEVAAAIPAYKKRIERARVILEEIDGGT